MKPTFTKKHFEVIEKILKNGREFPVMIHETGKKQISHDDLLADSFANMFEKQNPAFNREKFLTACGITKK